ncbi:glycoside hydrolase family 30 protein [Flavobacterium sp. MC2016-06]|uniref:glycoside hydrolase family 30 protein n=1 Tax=Flavobacterium sp. MC2016-06 TaxID=2676308 RepID=UPI0012BB0AE8|nr:glycoside hydrolase family 30 protein [Flavobacterium sp. MC2016-06]MBU3858920.1 glycosyl hydrolase [Flavobacterium sp. MC2016-06]
MNKNIQNCFAGAFLFLTVTSNVFAQKTAADPLTGKSVKVFVTAKNTDKKLTESGTLQFIDKPQTTEKEIAVFVDPSITFQTMLGIGGAITDASAEVFYQLPKDKQQEILTAYYDKDKGIGYTLARTNMQSCDFSSDIYSYIAANDKDLKTFDISHDEKYRIPLIKEAIAKSGGKLTLYASPWSPPAWMKTNNNVLQGGSLKPEFRQSWANFFVKFINAYEKEGIPIWGYTVQNEPMAVQRWESCIFTAEEERDFIKDYLGPTMKKAGLSKKNLIMWDHNRDLMYQRVSTVLEDKEAAKYVWGVGYHWYEDWMKNGMNFEAERRVAQAFPDKPLILTEGCAADFDPKLLTDWSFGEKYGMSMINDFNIGTVAWTDWNILLDEKGGPNHVQNFCMSPIHADLKTGALIYTNGYYYLGHFSKFIRPGAKRIACSASSNKLLSTAFVNPDGKLEIIVMNQGDTDVDYFLWIKGKAAKTTSLAHSIATVEIR